MISQVRPIAALASSGLHRVDKNVTTHAAVITYDEAFKHDDSSPWL